MGYQTNQKFERCESKQKLTSNRYNETDDICTLGCESNSQSLISY